MKLTLDVFEFMMIVEKKVLVVFKGSFKTYTRYSEVHDEELTPDITGKFETYITPGLHKVSHFRKLGGNKTITWKLH